MAKHRRDNTRSARRGAAAVELAFTLPLYLLLIVGIVEFGRAFMVQQIVTNASREGARYGVLDGSTNEEVIAKIVDYLAAGRIDANKVQITIAPENLQTATTGSQVKVGIRCSFIDVSWMPTPWFLRQAELEGETIMRHE